MRRASRPRWACVRMTFARRGFPCSRCRAACRSCSSRLRPRAAVDRAVPDTRLLDFEAYIFTTDRAGATDSATTYSRMFAPMLGVYEDPATGGASGPLGSYLVRHSLVTPEQARSILNLQGVKLGRPSWIHVSIESSDGDDLARARGRHVGLRRRRRDGSGGLERAHRIRPAPVQRRHAASRVREARRAPPRRRRRVGRAFRGLGAECRTR